METTVGKTRIMITKGDITLEDTDVIVNAANSSLLGGGGVDGAIHSAGGPQILKECKAIAAKQGGCPTGQAVITSGGRLKSKYVIHTAGPVWHGGNKNEPELLKNCYFNSLKLAAENRLNTIVFPSVSTGVYGYPIEKASIIAISTVKDFLKTQKHNLSEIKFILFSDYDFNIYKQHFL